MKLRSGASFVRCDESPSARVPGPSFSSCSVCRYPVSPIRRGHIPVREDKTWEEPPHLGNGPLCGLGGVLLPGLAVASAVVGAVHGAVNVGASNLSGGSRYSRSGRNWDVVGRISRPPIKQAKEESAGYVLCCDPDHLLVPPHSRQRQWLSPIRLLPPTLQAPRVSVARQHLSSTSGARREEMGKGIGFGHLPTISHETTSCICSLSLG